jgi:putative membrane protein
VLASAASSADGVGELRQGVAVLTEAARELTTALDNAQRASSTLEVVAGRVAAGGERLRTGLQALEPPAKQLTVGVGQAGATLKALAERQPPADDLQRLKAGAHQLAAEQVVLGRALRQLRSGAGQLHAGAAQLREEAKSIPLVGGAVEEVASELETGAMRLEAGLGDASKASDGLASGAARLSAGVQVLADGTQQFGAALAQLSASLPDERTSQALPVALREASQGSAELALGARRLADGAWQLAGGLSQLSSGSQRVSGGLQALIGRLPTSAATIEGSPAGLSESVKPVVEIVAPVANQGSGFAPNFIPLALWVGATLCAFLFSFRALPDAMLGRSPLGLVLGKLALPALLVCAQSLVMLAMLFGLLGVQVDNTPRFVFALLLTALTFLTLIFVLVRLLGDAGKLAAFMLLVVQLAAAGATMPIELTTPFFQAIHPYLPMTWVVRMVRIAMFGAFEGAWIPSALVIGGVALGSIAVATMLGRWRPVAPKDYRPPLDIG